MAVVIFAALVVGACGGGGDDDASGANANIVPSANQPSNPSTSSAMLSWTPPLQNTNGSALTNLSGYKVYWGKTQGTPGPNQASVQTNVTTYMAENLTPGTWYFVVTALNSQGAESNPSNTAQKVIQ